MEKVVAVGCPGVGEEEFAKELSKKTGIPYYDMSEALKIKDKDFAENIPFSDKIQKITKKPAWITNGNYKENIEDSDTVFFFDFLPRTCIDIIRKKPDCKITWSVIMRYDMDVRPGIIKVLDKYRECKEIIVFNSIAQAVEYINAR